ncbi:MAG: class I SAM-dependent methyltransferase [Bacteroidales bacterium]
MSESFQPISHYSKNKILNKILFLSRLLLDFQFKTLYFNLKKELSKVEGNVIDVGCGDSPYKHLLGGNAIYTGLDYNQSSEFNYKRTDVIYFDGNKFPFANESFDFVLCTEVLEHIPEPYKFIDEVYRILKFGGKALITVPWSARYHYIPNDYFRYTPTTLHKLFCNFKEVIIKTRGTDLTAICSKSIVFYAGLVSNILKREKSSFKFIYKFIINSIFVIILLPLCLAIVVLGHISLLLNIGSSDDCLGYTVLITKS